MNCRIKFGLAWYQLLLAKSAQIFSTIYFYLQFTCMYMIRPLIYNILCVWMDDHDFLKKGRHLHTRLKASTFWTLIVPFLYHPRLAATHIYFSRNFSFMSTTRLERWYYLLLSVDRRSLMTFSGRLLLTSFWNRLTLWNWIKHNIGLNPQKSAKYSWNHFSDKICKKFLKSLFTKNLQKSAIWGDNLLFASNWKNFECSNTNLKLPFFQF